MKNKLMFLTFIVCMLLGVRNLSAMETNASQLVPQSSQESQDNQSLAEHNEFQQTRAAVATLGLLLKERCSKGSPFYGLTDYDFKRIADYLLKKCCHRSDCNFVTYSLNAFNNHTLEHDVQEVANAQNDLLKAFNLVEF